MDIIKKFELGKESRTYQRIDPSYKVNIFLGYNDEGQMSMVISENGMKEKISSSRFIELNLYRSENQKLSLSFDLQDQSYSSMFAIFCKDMIEVAEKAGKQLALSKVLARWKYWREMFGVKSFNTLSFSEIKGLIGELYALYYILIPKYGIEHSIKGWMGPSLGHKDFEIKQTWYEVKTISEGVLELSINSLEQLESDIEGHLIVVVADKTSINNDMGITLNQFVAKLSCSIKDHDLFVDFRNKLLAIGYAEDSEYDNYNFIFGNSSIYKINDSFPRIKRSEIDSAIGNAKYTILMAGIVDFKEE